MTKKLTLRMMMEIAHHEAVVREAYKDSVGVWTWGVGVTNASGHRVTRYIDNPQTLERCLEVYEWLLRTKYLPDVLEAFEGFELTEAQLTAALSFHWNTGGIKRASWVRQWKAGQRTAARSSFLNWNKPPEIRRRREAERDLFFDGTWAGEGKITEWTMVKDNGRIDWSKQARRDVTAELTAIMERAA